jgi:protein-tyrosine phosphatase
MTFCPGKTQAVSISGGWQRDLSIDLDAVDTWGARVLVSLMEPHEFERVGVSLVDLPRQAAKRGIEWIHVPITDGSVPDAAFLEQWRVLAPHLRAALERGERVVFHCLGGLGRTGMMAACLLIETGSSPQAAMIAVRTARRGTIENRDQEEFVLRYERVTPL